VNLASLQFAGSFGKARRGAPNSRRGQCSRPQRAAREALLRAGALWWICRSANAAMWALAQSGVTFRTIVHEDGTLEHCQQPELPAWEVPKQNPHERRPRARRIGSRGRRRRRLTIWRRRRCVS